MLKVAVSSLTVFMAAGCATVPPPEPQHAEAAGVAIYVETYAPLPMFAQESGTVYFVRLDDGATGGIIPASQDILASNSYSDGYAYLLNVPAGRYAAVGCSKEEGQTPMPATSSVGSHGNWSGQVGIARNSITFMIYFPEEVVALTEVEVGPGVVAFMGSYALDTDVGLDEGDELQRHYYARMAPDAHGRGILEIALRGGAHYTGSLRESDKGAAALRGFKQNARNHFQQSGWLEALR